MTLLGIGCVPAHHPLNLGMMGMHGEHWVNEAIQEADLLIALGMRFDDRVTGSWRHYAPNAKEDPHRHRSVRAAQERARRCGDRRGPEDRAEGPAARSLDRRLTTRGSRASASWRADRRFATSRICRQRPLCAAHVIHDIWKATAAARSSSPTSASIRCGRRSITRLPSRHVHHLGRPRHDGLRRARGDRRQDGAPDREVWAIVGDGGFQMTQAELQTMVQENVKVNIAIINNGYLGMVRQWQQFFHDRRYSATPMSSPDYVKLADAHGLPGIRVTRREDMADALKHARASAGAVVMDFRVEQEDTVYPMVSPGRGAHDMIKRPARSRRPEPTCCDRRAASAHHRRPLRARDRRPRSRRRHPAPQRVRAEAFTAVASQDRATVQATIMFDSSDKTAARIVSLLERQIGVLAVEDWTSEAKDTE
jgi:acetolactate synthase-1/2/3 large subunit